MNETIIIISCVVLLLVVGIFFYRMKSMDSFDITVEPVKYKTLEETPHCDLSKEAIAIPSSEGPSYRDFIQKYGKREHNSHTVRKYCTHMYEHYHDNFMDRWHSISECEHAVESGNYD